MKNVQEKLWKTVAGQAYETEDISTTAIYVIVAGRRDLAAGVQATGIFQSIRPDGPLKGGDTMITYDSLFLMLQFGMMLLAMLTFIDNRSNKRRR